MQIEQRMATKIMEEEEKRMFHEMNEQEQLKAEHRWASRPPLLPPGLGRL